MGKTRRKLYGKIRRRRQRGGGGLWWTLFGALAAAKGAEAGDPGIRELASKWWIDGGWKNAKAFADGLTDAIPTLTLPEGLFEVKSDALWTAPPPDTKISEEEKEIVEPYLTEVDLKGLTYGPTYEWNGKQFEYDTWSNKGDTVEITTGDGTVLTDVPMTARFKVVSVPPEDDVEGGRRRGRVSRGSRKQRRKTLRRKK
jgi:hypothetical protein